MKVFLDDLRRPPEGWVLVKTVPEVQELVKSGVVEELSLDNDLGPGTPEGYTLVDWMAENNVWPQKKPRVHSMNIIRAAYMRAVIERYFPVSN